MFRLPIWRVRYSKACSSNQKWNVSYDCYFYILSIINNKWGWFCSWWPTFKWSLLTNNCDTCQNVHFQDNGRYLILGIVYISGWRWLSWLLSQSRIRATGSIRRAGVFREEVSHRLRRLLSLRESFRKALHSWSKQAAWRDRSVKEGNLVHLFHLHHREPDVAFQHYQAGHRPPVAWAVACRARSVALLRSLSEAASRPASSLASILAWKTWSSAIESVAPKPLVQPPSRCAQRVQT